MYKFIDADYYGFRDEEDGVLAAVEGPAEEAMRSKVRPAPPFFGGVSVPRVRTSLSNAVPPTHPPPLSPLAPAHPSPLVLSALSSKVVAVNPAPQTLYLSPPASGSTHSSSAVRCPPLVPARPISRLGHSESGCSGRRCLPGVDCVMVSARTQARWGGGGGQRFACSGLFSAS